MNKRQRKKKNKMRNEQIERFLFAFNASMIMYDILFHIQNMFDEIYFWRKRIFAKTLGEINKK
jgi:hypothetical protein